MSRWHDPTHGRIDRDIQEHVDSLNPKTLGQRVAMENTLQEQRRRSDLDRHADALATLAGFVRRAFIKGAR